MFKSLITTVLCVLIVLSSLLAQNLPKTLLWKISGNGLGKPSYLYGTMHVYDPRLFNLGDSLLQAISSSEGFANELDLNQITPMLVDFVNRELSKSVTVKEMLNKKAFDKYGPALAKKFDKPADEITSMDILKEKNKWIDESYKGKKMQTFLDAYLTDLAYRQGKWIGGVEDFADQSGLLNSAVDESDIKQLVLGTGVAEKAEMENMVTIYQNSDLDGFQKMLTAMDSNTRDVLLIRRNRKMAFRMDSLSHRRSMVFAVGAAHLPGEEGLISLLRKKGYSVDPVFYSKKIKPENYYVPEIAKPWVQVIDPEGHYKVMMPGTPGDVKFYGVLTMSMYFNIFNGTWYLAASASLPYDQKGLDSVEKSMLKQLFGPKGFKEETLSDINGIPGKSYVQKNTDGYKKAYLLYKDNMLYYAVAFSASDTASALKSVDRFFASYKPIPVNKDLQANHFEFVDSVRAYGILLPAAPKSVNNMIQTGASSLKVDLMISTDPQTGTYYFVGSTETTRGYAFQDDSSAIQSVHDNMLGKFQDITRDTSYSLNEKRILESDASMINGSMRSKTKIVLRGNRYYTLLIMYGPGKWDETANKVLSSFHLKDYTFNRWNNITSPDSLFSTWVPDRILFYNGTDSNKTVGYESFDSTRANTYSVKLDTLEKYFWVKNDSALWDTQKTKYVAKSDTVLSERIFKKDGLYQYELFKRARGGNNIQRMQWMVWDNLLYRLVTSQEPGTIREANVNRYYDQFRFNHPVPETHLFESKAMGLLKDLQSPDSNIRRQADAALYHAPFDKNELGLLREAVIKSYPTDSSQYKSVNQSIAERIIELDDSSSVDFARTHFTSVSQPDIKDALLAILSAYHTKTNYESLGRLLLASAPKNDIQYWAIKKWYDSLELAASLFPTVLPLLKDSVMAPEILDIASDLLDSNLVSISIFAPWQETILKYADRRYRITKTDTLNFTVSDYSVINLLKRFKNSASNTMLKKWLQVDYNIYHKQAIVLALLENNQPVGQQSLTSLAANKNTRIGLYKNLKKYKKSALFPVKYFTQSYFAESLAEDAASAFSDDEADISFIKVREMKWKGKTYRFFFYDVFLNEDNEHWLAVSGPFNMNRVDVSLPEAKSDVYSTEQYNASNMESQMMALVDQMEKDGK
jgi:uncharacterized protein YbaP (TraB family)